ncbi:endonuclease exonuclease phosphatase family [Lecanosticta acicola]|uniref:Endonuclease exonuclease phosphatase family n=1 Tax=Lecanosticta acicola TaxID=111012 RepID=A0AAI9ED54_9PEZI|nr:endonuclease exonuclease phosphatase family [Lecanosticta acicola]
MEELVQESLKQVQEKARGTVPWKPDEVWSQDCNIWKGNEWTSVKSTTGGGKPLSVLALYSWNIDFMLPYADSRMNKALDHLRGLISQEHEATAKVVFLQECVFSDIKLLTSHSWIRETFVLSDVDVLNWQSGHYGTVTLIDRRLPISSVFRVHYAATRMERDGLFVDVKLNDKTVRLCNTHLESLALEPPYRIPQMKLCAEYMRASHIHGAIAAGDFNAIQGFDKALHSDNGLKDAYLERGGKEDDLEGHTWGQQAATKLREQFGTTRMDKVFFCGGLDVASYDKFGADVCVDEAPEQELIVKLGFDKPWITDHLGVKAVFRVLGS